MGKFKKLLYKKNRFIGEKWTIERLLQKQKEIEDDPKYKNPDKKSIYRHTPHARRMLDEIAWAITYYLQEKKKNEKKESMEEFMKRTKLEIERKYNKAYKPQNGS